MGLADPRSVPPQSSNWTRKGVSWQFRKKGLGGLVGGTRGQQSEHPSHSGTLVTMPGVSDTASGLPQVL